MNKNLIFSLFILISLSILILLFYNLTRIFFEPLFWATTISLLTYPLYRKLNSLLKNRSNLSSLLMTLLVTCVLLIPIIFITINLGIEAFDIYETTRDKGEFAHLKENIEKYLKQNDINDILPENLVKQLETKFNMEEIKLSTIISKPIIIISNKIVELIKNALANTYIFALNFVLTIFSLFFFFRDGRKFTTYLLSIIPMNNDEKIRIFTIFSETIHGIALGSLLIAAIQGLLVGLIFLILNIPYPVFAGSISFVLSILPLVGAALVWLPFAIYYLVIGSYIKGLILLVFGAVVISSVDNLIRPIIIGSKLKINTLLLFLSIIGGLEAYGFAGLIIGPLIIALLTSFIELYKTRFISS
ncbi:MAG: AI-2E family transporter [Candidatus Dadabacteria bacterium]|nr:AI-2E family transporter [Candidatus Dadabacteria bacterium]NIQ13792.1 AI-2E family transporter [Candidatus Dadabacteria bacterium]